MDALTRQEFSARHGTWISGFYDDLYAYVPTSEIVDFVSSQVKKSASIIEFSSATGNVTTALADAGFTVTSLEWSDDFLIIQREKDPLSRVEIVKADFVDVALDRQYDACLVLNNALNMLSDPEDQLTAIRQSAAAVRSGGQVIVDTYAPWPYMGMKRGESRHTVLPHGDALLFDLVVPEFTTQQVVFVRSLVQGGQISSFVEPSRYVWPAELDLMAATSGLTLVARWANWRSEVFTADKPSFISIYEKSG